MTVGLVIPITHARDSPYRRTGAHPLRFGQL